MKFLRKLLFAGWVLFLLIPRLHAQLGPTITNQPASQTNLPGTTVSFSVGVNGTGPFSYQWQFNGASFPNNLIATVEDNYCGDYVGDDCAANQWSAGVVIQSRNVNSLIKRIN